MRKTTNWAILLLVVLVAGFVLAPQALAQNPTGDLTGKVTDPDGAALPGVTVTATSPNLQGSRVTTTATNGTYKLALLPPGTYTVNFELEGFATVTQQLTIQAAQSAISNIQMKLAEVAEEIEVTGNVASISETGTGASTYNQNEIDKLPIGRTIRDATLLAPGVSDTGPNGNISIAGAMSFENLFLVNGVVVNENIRGQALPLFIEDAIQETTTLVSGVSAEYGRFSGGVVNAITKSGGNQISGSLRTSFTNDKWIAKTPLSQDRLDDLNETYEGTLGGYFWKDHIWFFGAGRNFDTTASSQTFVTNIPFQQTNSQTRVEGKLTVSPHPSHSLIGSYLKISQTAAGTSFGTFLDLASLTARKDPQEIKSGNYTGILTPSFFVEAQYSERDYAIAKGAGGPQDLIEGTLMRNRGTSYRYFAPTFCGGCEQEQRNNKDYLGKGSYFLTTEKAGTHDIVFGADHFDDIRFAVNHQTGSDFSVWSSNIIIDDQNNIFPQFLGTSTWIGWWAVFNLDQARPTSFVTDSYYVNDSWQLNDKWSFNLGVRYDGNDGTNGSGNKVAKDSKISPRVGLTYDVKGDGDLELHASYGTYVAAVANSQADSTSSGGAIGLFLSRYGGPLINTDPSCADTGTCVPTASALQTLFNWYFANGGTTDINGDLSHIPMLFSVSIPGATAIIPNTIKSPSTDEYSLGITKRLGRKGTVRADLVYRTATDFYSNNTTVPNGTVDTSSGPVDLTLVGNFGNSVLERTYKGLHTQFRFRPTDKWTIQGSYTLSQLYGNVNGETGPSGPVSTSPFNYPEFHQNSWSFPKGDLLSDQRHRLRLWAIYDIFNTDHNSLSASVLQSYFSGTPYGAVGSVDPTPFVTNPGYAIPPTSVTYYFTARDAFHTDDITSTDLSLNYAFQWAAFGKSIEIFLQPEVLNVFNEHGVIGVNTSVNDATTTGSLATFNPFTTTPVEGVNWSKGSSFGQPTAESGYQTPRTFRFSVGLRF